MKTGCVLATSFLRLLALAALAHFASARAESPVDGFNPNANNRADVIALQPDGKILVGGAFTNVAGQPRTHLARLMPDATLEPAFSPNVAGYSGAAATIVNDLAVQPDGKIVVAGSFTNLAGHARSNIGRVHADGTADATPLNLITLHAAWRATGDKTLLERHLAAGEECLSWIGQFGDRDGAGLEV